MVAYALSVKVVDDMVPSTYRETESNPDSIRWSEAMEEEMRSLQKNDFWTLAHLPKDEEIYMIQPLGFKAAGKEDLVCKLKKSLYGLKQSPRQWYKRFDGFMIGYGYTRSPYDQCVYMHKLHDSEYVYLLLYVDDMLIAFRNYLAIRKLKEGLSSEFKINDLRGAKKILGMEIERDMVKGSLELTQKSYLQKMLKKFSFDGNAKAVSTQLAPHFKFLALMSHVLVEDKDYMSKVPYASAVDYAGDLDKRRSTSGYAFTLAGAPVCWRCTFQSAVDISTTETEYMAVTEAVKEALWLCGLLEDLEIA
ncbi:uncharacterized protein A4U43_C03F29880 [Asparagus officinalis]|uniref:Reverse transcriptase Ty1/copia-type domain-containing protein n=1 Tax=Asparagus officinalis TaxID=4686 RepID=A0A5P1FI72_ASPOF|nr:uncharacterized protein A4U43_C03F29880 [Asparagus officinalis]